MPLINSSRSDIKVPGYLSLSRVLKYKSKRRFIHGGYIKCG